MAEQRRAFRDSGAIGRMEDYIRRARFGLVYGGRAPEVEAVLVFEGLNEELAWLAVKAAELLARDDELIAQDEKGDGDVRTTRDC